MTETVARRLLDRSIRFLENFAGCFGNRSQRSNSRRYLRGLLGEAERKSMAPMVAAVTSTADYQSFQHFITNAPWDHEAVWKTLRHLAPAGPGLLLIDDTGFAKQGDRSVGVARQYSGTLGKTGNCQVAVGSVFVQKRDSWPIAFDLYLPEAWAKDFPRRDRAEVPRSVHFAVKWKIALRQVDRARRDGLLVDAVVADAGYGEIHEFRRELHARRLRYVMSVRGDLSLKREGREAGPAASVEKIAASLPVKAWQVITWRKGTKGPMRACFAAVRVRVVNGWPATGPWPRLEWLICEKPVGVRGKKRYYLSNLPPSTSLQRLASVAHARWQVEEYFERLKSEVGIDDFEGRSWPAWHHHVALAAMTYGLLEAERRAKRIGKKTFQAYRRILRRLVFLMMITERNEDVVLMMAFKRKPPPGWGFG